MWLRIPSKNANKHGEERTRIIRKKMWRRRLNLKFSCNSLIGVVHRSLFRSFKSTTVRTTIEVPQHGVVIIKTGWQQISRDQSLAELIHGIFLPGVPDLINRNRSKSAICNPTALPSNRVAKFSRSTDRPLPKRFRPSSPSIVFRGFRFKNPRPLIFTKIS